VKPVLPESSRDLGAVVRSTSIPVATGERLYSRWDFRSVLSDGIAVAQPDISHAGGISETRRIAAMAEAYDVLVAPHCPLGPIALAASLQLDFAIPNFLIQEQALGISHGDSSGLLDYLADTTPSRSATATSTARQQPISASPSTRTPCAPPPNAATAGAIPSGATPTAHWPPGSRTQHHQPARTNPACRLAHRPRPGQGPAIPGTVPLRYRRPADRRSGRGHRSAPRPALFH
jgi:hypothetical protein